VPLSLSDVLSSPLQTFSSLSLRGKVFVFACLVVGVELLLRRFAKGSQAYAAWTHAFETIGSFWTAVLLAVVYFASVSLVSLGMKLFGKDPLDRTLRAEPSFWRRHEPNPLGPTAAARHQF
jgi:hypothetical protein